MNETVPFIHEILRNLNNIICDLSQPQMHVFYEAVGHIIHVKEDRTIQDELIETLMFVPNKIWSDTIEEASKVYFLFCLKQQFLIWKSNRLNLLFFR